MCPVLQPSGESRVEVLDFNVHASGGGDSAGGSPGGPEELSSADPSLAGRNAECM